MSARVSASLPALCAPSFMCVTAGRHESASAVSAAAAWLRDDRSSSAALLSSTVPSGSVTVYFSSSSGCACPHSAISFQQLLPLKSARVRYERLSSFEMSSLWMTAVSSVVSTGYVPQDKVTSAAGAGPIRGFTSEGASWNGPEMHTRTSSAVYIIAGMALSRDLERIFVLRSSLCLVRPDMGFPAGGHNIPFDHAALNISISLDGRYFKTIRGKYFRCVSG